MNIAIDTCVFLHLLNKDPRTQVNEDSHIDDLLGHPEVRKLSLCVDTTNKIGAEYQTKLDPIVRKEDDTRTEIYILRFWMNMCPREPILTDPTDALMARIREVIPERNENADRAFVYVACRGDCCLVTNDGEHILPRRKKLWRRTQRERGENTKFLTSREAVQYFSPGGDAHEAAVY